VTRFPAPMAGFFVLSSARNRGEKKENMEKLVSFRATAIVAEWLQKMKAQGRSATWAINDALTRIATQADGGAE